MKIFHENKLNASENALLLHRQEGESTQQTTRMKNVFFTHNKEKAARNRFRGVESDENKLNTSETPCFSTHKKEKARNNKNKKCLLHIQQGESYNRFKGFKNNENKLKKAKRLLLHTQEEENHTQSLQGL